MANSYVLFSRDDRTFYLFRKCWIYAIQSCGISPSFYNRNFGPLRLVSAIFFFLKKKRDVRIIFGTSEICLYSIFSSNKDIFVFTGLGRLLQYPGIRRNVIFLFLRTFYRGQKIVALNPQDCSFIEKVLNVRVHLINGEGYFFDDFIAQEKKSTRVKVAYIGRLLKSKGVDVLINCFIKAGIDFDLYLIGDNDFGNPDSLDEDWLTKEIANSNGQIKRLGYINNVKSFLRINNINIYISLSEREGLPFSVLDAIDCGCFAVLSPVPGHLSFAHLDGIEYVNSETELISFISYISSLIMTNRWSFDKKKRLERCELIFGNKAISAEIVKLIL